MMRASARILSVHRQLLPGVHARSYICTHDPMKLAAMSKDMCNVRILPYAGSNTDISKASAFKGNRSLLLLLLRWLARLRLRSLLGDAIALLLRDTVLQDLEELVFGDRV